MKAVDGPIPEFWLELMKYLMSKNIFRYFWKIKKSLYKFYNFLKGTHLKHGQTQEHVIIKEY